MAVAASSLGLGGVRMSLVSQPVRKCGAVSQQIVFSTFSIILSVFCSSAHTQGPVRPSTGY